MNESDVIFGKLPPQAVEVEEAVLGALIVERDAILNVDLFADAFYKEEHQKIFKVIEKLNEEGKNIDLVIVTRKLKEDGILDEVGGPMKITELTSRIASAAHIEQHTRIILQNYIRRELIRVSQEIMNLSYTDSVDLDEIMQFYESAVTKIDNVILGKKKGRELEGILSDLTIEIEKRVKLSEAGGLTGITTGFGDLNNMTSGWQPNWLIIFAARPAMGKTAIAVNRFAKEAAKTGKWVNIFSLEMEDLALSERLVLGASGIDPDSMRHGKMTEEDWSKYNSAIAELRGLPIFIDDTPYVRISHIRNVARTRHRQGKCDMIIIDYLQLANAGGDNKNNREQQVAEMSRQLKALAKELGIPIIVLSQLSREVERRGGDKKPNMADLRESGSIEQDADLILFPWRPSYYGITPDVSDPNNYGELVFAKNRHGASKNIRFWHNGNMTDFSDMPFGQDRYYEKEPPVDFSAGMENSGFESEDLPF